jgi:ribonuclease HII
MLQLQLNTGLLEAGTDEAGRGCLAGPVVAAAVILPSTFPMHF